MRHARAIVGVLAGVTLFGLTAELAVIVVDPAPRAQIVRPSADVTLHAGPTPTWTTIHPEVDRHRCDDAPSGTRIAAFVGSSITRGSGVDGPEVFTERMTVDGWCVENHAEPAFAGEQKREIAMALLQRPRPPDRIYWEVWQNDDGRYVILNGAAWNLARFNLDSNGRPSLPIPGHAWLFDHSRAWQLLTLAEPPTSPDPTRVWPDLLSRTLDPVAAAAEAGGVELALVVFPPLDQPFARSASRPYPGYAAVWELAARRHLRWIRVDLRLEHEDVTALRADSCCHYNAAGHARLAELFAADLSRPPDGP